MDDVRRLEARGLARAKVRSQRRRVARIRRHTIRGSLALFSLFWVIIFGQLVTGNDPALSRSAKRNRPALSRAKAVTSSAPTPEAPSSASPEPEAEFEPEPEAEFEPESEAEAGFEPEAEPEAKFEPPPEPAPAIVTSAS